MQILIDNKYRTIYFKNNLIFYKTTKGIIDASYFFKKTGELKKIYTNLLKSDNTVAVIKKNKIDKKHGLTTKSLNSFNKKIKGGKSYTVAPIEFNLLKDLEIDNTPESIKKVIIVLLITLIVYFTSFITTTNISNKENETIDNIIDFFISEQNYKTFDHKFIVNVILKLKDFKKLKKSQINDSYFINLIQNILTYLSTMYKYLIVIESDKIDFYTTFIYNDNLYKNIIDLFKKIKKDSFFGVISKKVNSLKKNKKPNIIRQNINHNPHAYTLR